LEKGGGKSLGPEEEFAIGPSFRGSARGPPAGKGRETSGGKGNKKASDSKGKEACGKTPFKKQNKKRVPTLRTAAVWRRAARTLKSGREEKTY